VKGVHLDGDLIAAPATVDGIGELSLVRVSGRGCWETLRELLAGAEPPLPKAEDPARRPSLRASLHRGELVLGSGAERGPLPVLALLQPSGRSYTGEESVELLLPGIPAWVRAILALLSDHGIRAAGPGEFTRRAFESGRLDLTQAESVAALIAAESGAELKAARRTLEGGLAAGIVSLADRIHDLIALLEAGLDFADQEVEPPEVGRWTGEARSIARELREAAGSPDAALQEGIPPRLLIWGRANAGKSTLLNAWAGEDRALVSAREGTTTDAVSVVAPIDGLEVELVDLPGRKARLTSIEEKADALARRALEQGGPVLYLIDGGRPAGEVEEEWQSLPPELRQRALLVLTMVDRYPGEGVSRLCARLEADGGRTQAISALRGDGMESLATKVGGILRGGDLGARGAGLRFNERQRRGALIGAGLLEQVCAEAEASFEPELAAVDLRRAHAALEEITGEIATEDTLGRIFSRFCVGK